MPRLDKRSRHMNTEPMKVLRTIPDIVDAFGGKEAVASMVMGAPLPNKKDCKKNDSVRMILNWIAQDFIPPGWHYRMHLAAEARGYRIDPRALGVHPKGFENNKPARKAA